MTASAASTGHSSVAFTLQTYGHLLPCAGSSAALASPCSSTTLNLRDQVVTFGAIREGTNPLLPRKPRYSAWDWEIHVAYISA